MNIKELLKSTEKRLEENPSNSPLWHLNMVISEMMEAIKDPDPVIQNCMTCRHRSVLVLDEPCFSCDRENCVYNNWEKLSNLQKQ